MSLKSECERRFWIGVCAELAHQMGSPLSALMGWLEILPSLRDQNAAHIEMNRNLERLQLVSERLGQIGAPSRLEPVPLKDVLIPLRKYAEKRMPGGENDQRISLEIKGDPVANANPVLLPWALENFIKRALDTIRDASGWISLRAYGRKTRVFIVMEVGGEWDSPLLSANSSSPTEMSKPDYRAEGLAISRYIIREIHGGKIAMKKNGERGGTAIVISLNRVR